MDSSRFAPNACPSCGRGLLITRLECPACGTNVGGAFRLSQLASLPEPHASLVELFLRSRGNMKEMERELGISYPTVRARLEEALEAAGLGRAQTSGPEVADRRREILDSLEQGEIDAAEAATKLRELSRRTS